ncbi:TrkH family potassium uptake protein [Teichococcus vastitatis]|jgi:trk system potassium uptake protein TrkH|uniref:Trk system potassium uptake protein n=1 Tax=Teichococcus vastitatis TaxID=2307076 RepID=A0ABS9WC39_9PROT|nr:TrkH family potassium uptake protein [Pseudoroseomonas vastitatis]MCI0756860.1 TrkH family potassium uptake protein [Pseudoroseomonas vastitatis]
MKPEPMARRAAASWAPPAMRPVLHLSGFMLLALSGFMLLPAAVDGLYGNPDWKPFLLASLGVAIVAALMVRATRCNLASGLTLRQAFVLTPLSWALTSAAAAIPFFLSAQPGLGGHLTHSYFEAVSGLTTTGATVMSGLDHAPPGILLWRSLLQWLGGIGIIATVVAILPALGVGGMQLFRTESSDRSEKVLPRARQIAKAITIVYATLTLACGIAYFLAGMAPFEAVTHALSTISTAGFSTADTSLARWQIPAVHWIATCGMLAGALPFVLYVRALRGDWALWRDPQVRSFLGLILVVSGLLALWLWGRGLYGPEAAIRHAMLSVVSVVTTTGFASSDYTTWGNAATGLFYGLMFIGGCTGSTSGGMKIFRFEVVALMLRAHFLRLLYPRGVFPRVYGGKPLPDDVVGSVVVFFALYFICYGALTIALMLFELDFLTSASAAVSMLSNVGPGLGTSIGPSGNYAAIPAGAKWLLCFAMLLGRLELFTVLILFMPRFWRG